MAMMPNPYRSSIGGFGGYDPSGGGTDIGSGIANLGTALFGDPKTMMTRDLYNSEIAKNNAQTSGLNLDNDAKRRQADALAGLGAAAQRITTVTNPDGSVRQATPDEIRTNVGSLFQAFAGAYADPQKAADAYRMFAGMNGGGVNLDNAMMGAGGAYQNTQGGVNFTQGQETARNKYTADSHAGAVLGAARIAEGGAMARELQKEKDERDNPKPVSVAPGYTFIAPAGSKLAPAPGTEGIVPQTNGTSTIYQAPQRPDTLAAVQAQAAKERLAAVPPGPERDKLLRELSSPSIVNNENTTNSREIIADHRPDTLAAVQAQAAKERLAAVPPGPERDKLLRELSSPSIVNTETTTNSREIIADHRNVAAALNSAPKLPPDQTAKLSPVLDSVLNDKGIALDGAARDTVTARAAQLYSTSSTPGVRGNLSGAMEQAITELQASGHRTDYSWNPFSRPTYGADTTPAPGTVAGTAAPAAVTAEQRSQPQTQARPAAPRITDMPEGSIVQQGGRRYIIKGGQPVPLA